MEVLLVTKYLFLLIWKYLNFSSFLKEKFSRYWILIWKFFSTLNKASHFCLASCFCWEISVNFWYLLNHFLLMLSRFSLHLCLANLIIWWDVYDLFGCVDGFSLKLRSFCSLFLHIFFLALSPLLLRLSIHLCCCAWWCPIGLWDCSFFFFCFVSQGNLNWHVFRFTCSFFLPAFICSLSSIVNFSIQFCTFQLWNCYLVPLN